MREDAENAENAARGAGDVKICNLTARRIAIAGIDAGGEALIVPPFGERLLSASQAGLYEYDSWRSQRLVRVEPVEDPCEGARSRAVAFAFLSGYSLLAALACASVWLVTRHAGWGYAAVGAAVVTALVASYAGRQTETWLRMVRSLNIFLGMAIAFGAPGAAILFVASDHPAATASNELRLALVLLWLFMGLASVLPAAMFLFFHRHKLPTLRGNVLRDVVRLDPNVQTLEDAERTYGPLISDVYGSATSGMSARGRLPILGATGMISGFWMATMLPGLGSDTSVRSILLPDPDPVTFAFLGAYVFAVNMLFRRYARADLGPKAYTHVMVRTFAAVVTAWVLTYAPFATAPDGDARSMTLLLAFFIGVVPETGLAVIQDILRSYKPVGRVIPSLAEEHPLTNLEGISLYDRSHLLEMGVENVESLAHHNLIDLMLWSRIPTARLIDFVDQSILYLHVRGPLDASQAGDADPDGARTFLRRHGIRTATDLERTYSLAAARSSDEAERLLSLLDSPAIGVHRLRLVMDAIEDDEWLVNVRNWRKEGTAAEPVTSVEEFVRISAAGSGQVLPSQPPSAVEEDQASPPSPEAPAPATPLRAAPD